MNHEKSTPWKIKNPYFFFSIFFLCLSYALFAYFFIPYSRLGADEFVFARHIYEYTFALPYRDFLPYKTVLGYYFLSLPFFFSHEILQPLFYIKDEIALINILCFALTAYLASSFFDKKAILFALFLVLANQLFLLNGTDLRVDMMTSWMCLFSTLFILQKRFQLSGGLLGLAFLISQKALWYFIAINGAMFICYFCCAQSFSLRSFVKFNSAVIVPIVIYFLFWSLISSPIIVFNSLFYEAYLLAKLDWYMPIYSNCWLFVLFNGPLLFFLWPLSLCSLFKNNPDQGITNQRIFIMSFASIALLLFIKYKQPFPYNFVFTIPAFFLLYAEMMTWLYQYKMEPFFQEKMSTLIIFIICFYSAFIFLIINTFYFPPIYNLIPIIPFLFFLYLYPQSYSQQVRAMILNIMMSLILISGIIYPLYQSSQTILHTNGKYQQDVIQIAANLMDKDSDYLSGIPFFYQKDQTITGMQNLIGPAINYIHHPRAELEPLLMPSLYLAPTTSNMIMDELEKKQVKVIIDNYRLNSLPLQLKNYIWSHYKPYYGSILLYAPTVSAKQLTFYLKFDGDYLVETSSDVPSSHSKTPAKSRIEIDGKKIYSGKILHLKKGDHLTDAKHEYRLVFIPKKDSIPRLKEFEGDQWLKMIKPIVGTT